MIRSRSFAAPARAGIRIGAAAIVSLTLACTSTRDRNGDSVLARTAVPDSIIATDTARPATEADSTAVETWRVRLNAADDLLHSSTAFAPLYGPRLSVQRDATQSVVAALFAPDRADSTAAPRYLYLFDDRGMTTAVERTWSDSSPACAGRGTTRERWIVRDGRIIRYDRTLNGSLRGAPTSACGRTAAGRTVLYTSWPMLANAAMPIAP